jgi:chromosomal replication initiation ATPase DnaA
MLHEVLQTFLKDTKPIYVTGRSGSGKTPLLRQIPNVKFISMNEIQEYDDLHSLVQPTIMDLFHGQRECKVCVIDDLDYLHNHEKKVLKSLAKQFSLEEKKKKKRSFTLILSGTNEHDKNVKEIMKMCNVVRLTTNATLPYNVYEKNIQQNISQIMLKEFKQDFLIDNEKATQALLFHENIIDCLRTYEHLRFYQHFLRNFCIGDYFDRVSFQKQLWVFNEMTYYIKILHNYFLYQRMPSIVPKKVATYRFTKVLTKYSNEYNNNTFVIRLCNRLNCTKKELYYKLLSKEAVGLLSSVELNRAMIYFQLS